MRSKHTALVKIDNRWKEKIDGSNLYMWHDKQEHEVRYDAVVAVAPSQGNTKLQVGDKVYFNYNVLLTPGAKVEIDGEDLWKVPYEMIFCLVRDGEVQMVGEWCLVEIITEERGFLAYKETHTYEDRGILSNLPTAPWNGEPLPDPASPGDTVCFHERSAFRNYIEGQWYYTMRYQDLNCVL